MLWFTNRLTYYYYVAEPNKKLVTTALENLIKYKCNFNKTFPLLHPQ